MTMMTPAEQAQQDNRNPNGSGRYAARTMNDPGQLGLDSSVTPGTIHARDLSEGVWVNTAGTWFRINQILTPWNEELGCIEVYVASAPKPRKVITGDTQIAVSDRKVTKCRADAVQVGDVVYSTDRRQWEPVTQIIDDGIGRRLQTPAGEMVHWPYSEVSRQINNRTV